MRIIPTKTSRGDTIVEVLVAILIVSLILAGAYVTASNSLTATREAQESSEALKLIEGQAEALRTVANVNPLPTAPNNVFAYPDSFCLNANNNYAIIEAFKNPVTMGNVGPASSDQGSQYTTGVNGCAVLLPSGSSSVTYDLSIDRCETSPLDDTIGTGTTNIDCNAASGMNASGGPVFIIRARWDQAGGDGRGEASFLYRVFPFLPSNSNGTAGANPVVGGGNGGGLTGGQGRNGPDPNPIEYAFIAEFNDANKGYPSNRTPTACTINWGDGGPTQTVSNPVQCASYASFASAQTGTDGVSGVFYHNYCNNLSGGSQYPVDNAPDSVSCTMTPTCNEALIQNQPGYAYHYPGGRVYTITLVITDSTGTTTILQPTESYPICD